MIVVTTNTKRLLLGGVVGGPLFVVVGLVQALTRHGFDLTRQPLSLLTLGSAGWIQTASFLVTGALAIAFATGMRRVLRDRPGGTWGRPLVYVDGAGLIVGGLFHPDAGDGFPPGTPSGQSVVRTWHGALHQTGGMLAFLALLAACFVLARYYRSCGQPRNSPDITGRRSGVHRLPDGMGSSRRLVTLFIGVTAAMLWMALVARQLIAAPPTRSVHDRSSTWPLTPSSSSHDPEPGPGRSSPGRPAARLGPHPGRATGAQVWLVPTVRRCHVPLSRRRRSSLNP